MEEGMTSFDVKGSVELRRKYWKLEVARKPFLTELDKDEETQDSPKRPITCLLSPGLTPARLLEHLQSRRATDACILEWTRRLQSLRQEHELVERPSGVMFLGKPR